MFDPKLHISDILFQDSYDPNTTSELRLFWSQAGVFWILCFTLYTPCYMYWIVCIELYIFIFYVLNGIYNFIPTNLIRAAPT